MEEGVVHRLLRGPLSSLFENTLLVTDVSGAGNNWAYGHEVYGQLHGQAIADTVARAMEMCDSPQGFLLLHSLGGGTGSGLGTRCLEMLADLHPQLVRLVCAISPADNDDVVTSPYNTALALHELRQHATLFYAVNCDSRIQAAHRVHKTEELQPFAHANGLVARMLAHLTSGPLDVDFLDLSSNLVPYRGLHFVTAALSPLRMSIPHQQASHIQTRRINGQYFESAHRIPSCSELLLDSLGQDNQLLDVCPKNGM
ncbi:hypothetical protein Esti_005248 [Eimeria stiedai]